MKLYMDDDSVQHLLVRLLRGAGHDVQTSAEAGLEGVADPVHFRHAVLNGRMLFSANHDDFLRLHRLIIATGGRHPGVLMHRQDNDQTVI